MWQKIGFSIIILLLLPMFSIGQECYEYHKNACFPPTSKFTYDATNNSVSFLFKSGEMRRVPLDLYAGKDYRITLCCDEVFNNVVSFKILKENGSVLYDNSQFNYALNIEFSSQHTQKVIMQIEIPDSSIDSEIKGCVGVLVEDMVSVKTGF